MTTNLKAQSSSDLLSSTHHLIGTKSNDPAFQHITSQIPIFLLKTPSKPTDAYAIHLSTPQLSPHFVPTLQHTFLSSALNHLSSLLIHLFTRYSGLIFTSQRAVEAFTSVTHTLTTSSPTNTNCATTKEILHSLTLPFYTVGPATSRALESLRTVFFPSCTVLGQETGNGEALAHYILTHHPRTSSATSDPNAFSDTLPLLFLVGEQRRDIIPKTLMNPSLSLSERLEVKELPVYTTTTLPTFSSSFASLLDKFAACPVCWIVVFSPMGCEAMLKVLGWLDEGTGKVIWKREEGVEGSKGKIFVAAIGPTTEEYLAKEFGFQVDVCAQRPSPEGVREGIEGFMRDRGLL